MLLLCFFAYLHTCKTKNALWVRHVYPSACPHAHPPQPLYRSEPKIEGWFPRRWGTGNYNPNPKNLIPACLQVLLVLSSSIGGLIPAFAFLSLRTKSCFLAKRHDADQPLGARSHLFWLFPRLSSRNLLVTVDFWGKDRCEHRGTCQSEDSTIEIIGIWMFW